MSSDFQLRLPLLILKYHLIWSDAIAYSNRCCLFALRHNIYFQSWYSILEALRSFFIALGVGVGIPTYSELQLPVLYTCSVKLGEKTRSWSWKSSGSYSLLPISPILASLVQRRFIAPRTRGRWCGAATLILFHLRRDQRLTTTKPYLFTIGQMFNPNSMNNLQLREFVLSLSNYASLNSWPRNRGHQTRAERQRITWIRSKKMKWCKWLPCAILSNLHWQAVAIFPRMMPLSYNCLNWSKHSAASSFSG